MKRKNDLMSRDERKQMALVIKILFNLLINGEITDLDIRALESILYEYPEVVAEDFFCVDWIREYLEWKNGKEWGEMQCPMLNNRHVMTYYPESVFSCYLYTAPFVACDEQVCYYKYDNDKKCWDETLYQYHRNKCVEGMTIELK